ncbi:hypothetical protein GCK72_007700 [Caenorhabditis remanei]|uniref:Nuclear receptor domain-containing protein n=1 Tax=Caenorhabditis remanei TaxID=31234 RepID=A0A6A5HKT4_CAERE|nr:hypothetical protein GCK72_007700 [Caenorhabditis remanei]KAF1767741.1 hypothetical protein GCK72_007700 [Caenorhabditis remanei]
MSATYSEEPLVKNVKIEDHFQPFSTLLDAIKLEEYENQLVTPESTSLKDQNRSEVSTSKSVMGNHEFQIPQQESFDASQKFQATPFQNTNDILPKDSVLVVQQQTKSHSVRRPPLLSDHMDLNPPIHPTSKRKECMICGDIPVGYNYGVLTCEGCKIFFQRYYHRHAELKCRMHSTCFSKKMDKNSRRYCQSCRMTKCLAQGMKCNQLIAEKDKASGVKNLLQNIFSIKRMSATNSEELLVNNVKIEDHSQPFSTLLDAIKLEEYENQLIQETSESTLLEDQNRFPAAEVSTSKSVMGNREFQIPQQESFEVSQEFQVTHFQNPNDIFPNESVVQQQTPPNFDEDSRQISHQIMRVAANSTKDRQDCFRQLLFATVFAFESSPTCTNVEEFFRMMGDRYARK